VVVAAVGFSRVEMGCHHMKLCMKGSVKLFYVGIRMVRQLVGLELIQQIIGKVRHMFDRMETS